MNQHDSVEETLVELKVISKISLVFSPVTVDFKLPSLV